MSFDPGDSRPGPLLPHEIWYRMFTDLIFDSFVKGVVREHYHQNPAHVTLHIDHASSVLFIQGHAGISFVAEDPDLREWALGFIAGDVFDLNPEDVDTIYLDGVVGGRNAYLHISGRGILISSGEPKRGGHYL